MKTQIMGNKITYNVAGAPFCIGDTVKVIRRSDDTISARFIRRKGKVIYFDYTCGCGQSYPNDPMIGVEFKKNFGEEFWREGLALISRLDKSNKLLYSK